MMKKNILVWLILCILVIALTSSNSVFAASEQSMDCQNRYLVLVNPVRGRDLWVDKSLKPLDDQYNAVKENSFAATWLLQYNALGDRELVDKILNFDSKQEVGVFLEISENLTNKARVIYKPHSYWYNPKSVFLSGYTPSERLRLIDEIFEQFKTTFGFYPKSVGAWWIDSYSLDYMVDKYGIKGVMIVADQKTTDGYGIWGQWWGIPYYPTKANILVPADNIKNQEDVVVIQWAQRDLLLANGEGPKSSNHSLQANDYIGLGFDTEHFKKLSNVYLDCNLSIGQITVGLETGMESVSFIDEYKKQLEYLKTQKNLEDVTLSSFYDRYKSVYPQNPQQVVLKDKDAMWILDTKYRNNEEIKDRIKYEQNNAFQDYFIADYSDFLNRRLPENLGQRTTVYFPGWILASLITFLISYKKKLLVYWAPIFIFSLGSFGLFFRSFQSFGWIVVFGPVVHNVVFWQTVLIVLIFTIFLILFKYMKGWKFRNEFLMFLPVIFCLDIIIQKVRISTIDNWYYLGFMPDDLRFIGFKFNKLWQFNIINEDFPSYIAAAFLKFDYQKVTDNLYYYFILSPLVHIVFAIILSVIVSYLFPKLKYFIFLIMFVLTLFYFLGILSFDPRIAI